MSNPIVPRSVPIDKRFVSRSELLMIARRPRSPHLSAGDISTCCAGVWGTAADGGCADPCVVSAAVPFPTYGVCCCGGCACCCCGWLNELGGGTPGGAPRGVCGCGCDGGICELGGGCAPFGVVVGNAELVCALGLAFGEFHAAAASAWFSFKA